MNPYPDFERRELEFLGETREVFVQGKGPAILVMHEAPGLYPGVAAFGRRLVERGYSVFMPSLVGTPGREFGPGYAISTLARACVMKEFSVFATGKNSPVTEWLRALGKHMHEECGGPGIGAVGMCLTGGFALALMVDPHILAPVLSQPSLPFALTGAQKRDLGIDGATLERVKQRAADGACVLGLRFTHDRLVPAQRFQRLRDELGDAFMAVEIDSGPGNEHGIGRTAHSVLVYDLVDEPGHPTRAALDRVMAFFDQRLRSG